MRGSISWRMVLVLAVFSAVIAVGAGSAHAATIIYEPFADSNPSLTGNTAGTGLTGTWSGTAVVQPGTLTYGPLPAPIGSQVATKGKEGYVSVGSTLTDAGLLADGAELWFSVLVRTGSDIFTNGDLGFELGTDKISASNNLPISNSGQALGFTFKNGLLRASYWAPSLTRSSTNSSGNGATADTLYMVAGKFTWGATSDTIQIYKVGTNLSLGSAVSWYTTPSNVNQSLFDTISFAAKNDGTNEHLIDEIRFGATYDDVLIFPTLSWDLNGTTAGACLAGDTAAGTWNAAGKKWNPELNGTGDPNAWLPGYVARFAAGTDATGTYEVKVDGQQDIWGLAFDEGNVTLTPALTGGELRLVKNSAEVDVASGLTATVAIPITEDATPRSLTKKGAGTIILSGANIYSGGTIVRAGTLVLGASDALPSGMAVTVAGNVAGVTATLDANGHSLTIGSLTLGGATATSGAAVTTGVGTLTLGGNVTYDNANNPLGATISGKLDLGAAARTFTVNNSTSTASELSVSAAISGTVGLIKAGTGTLVLSGNNVGAIGGMAINAGAVQFNSTGAINGTARDVTVNAGGAVVFGPSFGDANIPTALSTRIVAGSQGAIAADNYDATAFNFDTPGLTGASLGAVGSVSYTGALTPNGTTYRLGGGGGTLTMSDANAVTGSGNSLVVVGPGTVVIANSNDYDGTTAVSAGGTLQIGAGSTTGALNPDSAISVDGALVFKRSNTVTQGTDFSTAPINGSGSLTQAGTGTLILSAANNYTGDTTVSAGTLQLAHTDAIADSTSLSMASGTKLQLRSDTAATFNTATATLPSAATVTIDVNNNGSGTGNVLTLGGALQSTGTFTLNVTGGNGYALSVPTATFSTATAAGTRTINTSANTSFGTLNILMNSSNGDPTLVLSGSSVNSINTLALSRTAGGNRANLTISSGSWTIGDITGFSGNIGNLVKVDGGTLTITGSFNASGLGNSFQLNNAQLNYNSASAVRADDGKFVFNNAGFKLDNTSGAAITTSTHNPLMAWNANWTFVGSNGAASNLNLGTGAVTLGTATGTTRTVTVQNAATTLTIGGAIANGTTANSLTKAGLGTLALSGANTYSGATAVSAGTLRAGSTGAFGGGLATGTSGIAVTGTGRLNFYTGAGNAASPYLVKVGTAGAGTLSLADGTAIGGEIGGTLQAGVATTPATGTISIDVYGSSGVTPDGLTAYTLVQAASGLNGGYSLALGNVYNNSNFTVSAGDLANDATTIKVTPQAATPLTAAYWKGGFAGGNNVWAVSNGQATGGASNWTTDQAGTTATGLVPGVGTDVVISADSPSQQGNMVLGANMSVKSLTVNDANTVALTGFNTLTITPGSASAGITVGGSAGATTIGANVALGASQTWTNSSSSALTVSGAVSGAVGSDLATAGAVTISGSASYDGNTAVNSGSLTLAGGGNLPGKISLAGGTALNVNSGSNQTLGGAISGDATNVLTKDGTGILTLSAANSYGGGTMINSGTLTLGDKSALGSGQLTLAGGTTFQTTFEVGTGAIANAVNLSGGMANVNVPFGTYKDIELSGKVTGPGGLRLVSDGSGRWLRLSGTGNDFEGGVTLANVGYPTVAINQLDSLGTGTLRSEIKGTDLTKRGLRADASLTSGSGVTNTIDLAPGAHLVVDTQAFNLKLSGVIMDSGFLVKRGTGTLTLAGTNTYTGVTTVNQGTLLVNGNQSAATGAVTVQTGATLGGTGTIGGAVIVQTGGALAPGASAGTLNLGDLTIDGGGIFNWENNTANTLGDPGTNWDVANVAGAATISSTATTGSKIKLQFTDAATDFNNSFWDTNHSWDFITGGVAGVNVFDASNIEIFIDNFKKGTGNIITDEGAFTTAVSGSNLQLVWTSSVVLGDTNSDKVVDAADFITLKKNFGKNVGEAGVGVGDFNASGTVDWDDLNTLTGNMGTGGPAPSTTPEPATLGLLAIGALALLRRRRS